MHHLWNVIYMCRELYLFSLVRFGHARVRDDFGCIDFT